MPSTSKPHVALLASPGLGHLIPIVELAKCLVAQHEITITVFVVTTESHQEEDKLLHRATSSWYGLINTVVIPNQKADFPSSNVDLLTRLLDMMKAALPVVRSLISDMKSKPIALIVDQFGTKAFETLTQQFNMSKYVFIASNARFLSFNLYLPYVEKEVNPDEPFLLPGCDPIQGQDLPQLTFSPKERPYHEFVHMGLEIATVDGILVNTWEDLEAEMFGALRDEQFLKQIVKAPVYPIGPLVRMGEPTGLKSELIWWLDVQPNASVVYVSFGSGGTISTQQTIELAWGLELSKQRFVWVIRPPVEDDTSASMFDNDSMHGADKLFNPKYLPEGFMDRTRDLGFIVPMWAPQEEILSHKSIGGFVCHCGWNSSLESILNGVPIIAWPLYAEQRMNATMLVEDLGIAVQPRVTPTEDVVSRDEIAKMVRRVMVDGEGVSIRIRLNEMKASGNEALKKGGSSYIALSQVVNKIVT